MINSGTECGILLGENRVSMGKQPKDFDSMWTGSRKNHIDETGKNIYTIKNTDGVQQWKAKRHYHSYPIESITIFP